MGGWVQLRFPFHQLFAAVSISKHNRKKFCDCGHYAADSENAQREHFKSAEHKFRVAASKQANKQIAAAERANAATDCTDSAAVSSASASTSLGAPAAVQGGTQAAQAAKQGDSDGDSREDNESTAHMLQKFLNTPRPVF